MKRRSFFKKFAVMSAAAMSGSLVVDAIKESIKQPEIVWVNFNIDWKACNLSGGEWKTIPSYSFKIETTREIADKLETCLANQ